MTSSSSRSGERASLMMIDFEKRRSRCSSSRVEGPAGVDDHRRERDALLPGHLLEQLVAAHVGQVEVHHHAVEGRAAELRQRRLARPRRRRSRRRRWPAAGGCSRAAARRPRPPARGASVCESLASSWRNAVDQLVARDRLQRVADRAELERLVRVVVDRDDVHRHVAGARVALQLLEHAEAGLVGQVDVEQDGARAGTAPPPRGRRRRCARRGSGSRARAPGRAGSRRTPRRPRSPGSAASRRSSASRSSSTRRGAGGAAAPTAPAGAGGPGGAARHRRGRRRRRPRGGCGRLARAT